MHTDLVFFIPRLGCHQKVTASPLQGVGTGQKDKNEKSLDSRRCATRKGSRSDLSVIIGLVTPKTPLQDKNEKSIHTHTHSSQPLRHSLVLQERCDQKRVSFRPFGHNRSDSTARKASSGVPPEVPIPLHTASKVCPCLKFINHTIQSWKL